MTRRQSAMQRIKRDRPDLDENDDEAVMGAVSDDYAHFDEENERLSKENEEYAAREQQFADFLTTSEDNGQYFEGMLEGRDMFEVATEMHGYDNLLEYLQSEEARKKYKKANEEFRKRMEEDKRLSAERDKNKEETDKVLADAVQAGDFTEDEAREAIAALFDISDGLKNNVCKPEWVTMWLAAKNHDSDVDAARKEGHDDGVNEGIDKQMQQRRSQRGAGRTSMPVGAGGNGSSTSGGGKTLAEQLMG